MSTKSDLTTLLQLKMNYPGLSMHQGWLNHKGCRPCGHSTPVLRWPMFKISNCGKDCEKENTPYDPYWSRNRKRYLISASTASCLNYDT